MLQKAKCNRCGHERIQRVENPKYCPACKSPYWNKERIFKIASLGQKQNSENNKPRAK